MLRRRTRLAKAQFLLFLKISFLITVCLADSPRSQIHTLGERASSRSETVEHSAERELRSQGRFTVWLFITRRVAKEVDLFRSATSALPE